MNRMAILATLMAAAASAGCAGQEPLAGQAAQFADFRAGKDWPTYRAALVGDPPVVDGKMDEAYRSAEPIRLVFINGARRKPKAPTTARVVCTKDALYVFFRCRYRDGGGVKWSHKAHDTPIWHDNCVEVFLEPTGTGSRRYYQVIVNPGGFVTDLLARDPKAWDPQLEVKTLIRPGEWTAELRIPFGQLGLSAGKIKKVWRMNLTRLSLSPSEDTSWCVLGDYSSHTPGRFGYLWLEAGEVMNVTAQEMEPWRGMFNGRNLAGWRVVRGKVSVRDGMMVTPPGASTVVALKEPLGFDDLVVSADVMSEKQFRFMFARDPANEQMGFYATFINQINESNVAMMRHWEYWAPPMGGHLTIPHYGPCPMADDTWYRCEVRFRPDRVTMLLNGRVLLETANLYPKARWFGLHIIGAGKVKNVRIRKLVTTSPSN